MYNVTFRRVYVTIVAEEKQKVPHICACVRSGACMRVRACSLAYPARNAYVPYCDVICGPSGPAIFFDIIS